MWNSIATLHKEDVVNNCHVKLVISGSIEHRVVVANRIRRHLLLQIEKKHLHHVLALGFEDQIGIFSTSMTSSLGTVPHVSNVIRRGSTVPTVDRPSRRGATASSPRDLGVSTRRRWTSSRTRCCYRLPEESGSCMTRRSEASLPPRRHIASIHLCCGYRHSAQMQCISDQLDHGSIMEYILMVHNVPVMFLKSLFGRKRTKLSSGKTPPGHNSWP